MPEEPGPRADAVEVLARWEHDDPQQMRLRDEFAVFLQANADGALRTCRPAHLTASALVLDDAAERVLLTLHPKVGRWLQLGGHCEPGDATVRDAALREVLEESGIEGIELGAAPVRLDRHPVPCGPGGASLHLDAQFAGCAPVGARPQRSDESLDLRWFPVGALPDGTDPSVRALVADALADVNGR